MDNAVYEKPETAAEYILNLTGGVSINTGSYGEGQVMVKYTFADSSEVDIPMSFHALTREDIERIWLVDTIDVWNATAP